MSRRADGCAGRRGRAPGRCAGPAAAALLVVALLAGCSSVRANLGTTNGPCYVALPAAHAAVHGGGRLIGVRLQSVESLRRVAPKVFAVASASRSPHGGRVCLVAYVGHYTTATVTSPHGHDDGALAVVVLEYPTARLLGTIIVRHAPLPFGHSHLGG